MKKTLITIAVTALFAAFGTALVLAPTQPAGQFIGGLVHNVMEDFTAGISIGGTTILDSSGNLTVPGTTTITGLFRAPVTQSGSVTSIASGSVHYTAAQICDSSVIRHNVHGTGVTASNSADVFPTAATLVADCLPTAGDSKTFVLQNTSDDAAERITVTANTGLDFFFPSSVSAQTIERKDAWLVRVWNVNGSSVSFGFTRVEDTN